MQRYQWKSIISPFVLINETFLLAADDTLRYMETVSVERKLFCICIFYPVIAEQKVSANIKLSLKLF